MIEADIFDKLWYESDVGQIEPFNINLAIKCMGELKNIEIIRDTSLKLLKKTWKMVSDNHIYWWSEDEDIITSIKSVGKRWVGREILKDLILIFARDEKKPRLIFYIHLIKFGEFIGLVGAEDKDIKKSVVFLLKRDHNYLRIIALNALAFGWYDEPDTLKLIQDSALNDSDWRVRETAISLIGQKWQGDTNNLKILQNCALTDNEYSVRNSAIQVIATSWSNNPNALPFLCDLAKSASDFNVRQNVLQQIGNTWIKDNTALEVLKDRAANDTYSGVREIAVSFLGEQWKDDIKVLSLLRERASRERNPAIQKIIYKILAVEDV